ncbi:MAG: peptide chain release factor N(5)-glutamine methyltransferase [Rhodocyclaceae bacterium]|nr:peptide chain release factor N(5)-glutamine methyltransferase [Rhodocyclaceae bacterium]
MIAVVEALATARQRIPAAEARLLLEHVLGRPAAWLEAHREGELSPTQGASFNTLVERRAAGEPVAYLIGRREFYGRDFTVTLAVLIPRPETELLVDLVKAKVGAGGTAHILDLGTGSGCIAVTLALELPLTRVTAVDVSLAALEVAHANATRLGASIEYVESNWFAGLREERFDLIAANPPYVASGDPHLAQGDLRFEPVGALTDHADGLAAIRHIVATAPRWLKPGGGLLFEHGYDQERAVRDLLVAAGFADIEQHSDLAGIVRVSGGRMPD